MRSIIDDDSNQFGPGTDLVICLFATMMVLVFIVTFLYRQEKDHSFANADEVAKLHAELEKLRQENKKLNDGGKFKFALGFLTEDTFEYSPPTKLKNPFSTQQNIDRIISQYNGLKHDFPFIFIIGHANQVNRKDRELPYEERLSFNWGIAGERASVLANLLQKGLSESEKNNIVLVSSGEFDLKIPSNPIDPGNAYVEVYFGREWKPEAAKGEQSQK
jgi:flagellar motor protein MotB